MTARRRISAKERLAIFASAGGCCHWCRLKIDAGRERWDVDHVVALGLGGEDGGENLQPIHEACHRTKTGGGDAPAIAKAKRQEQRTTGVKRQPQATIPGSRATRWKRKIDGTVVRRRS